MIDIQAFFDCILMGTGKCSKNQIARVGLTRVHVNLRAFSDHRNNAIHVMQIKARINALTVKIHRHDHDVHVAGTLTVAKQGSFNTLSTCHHCKLCSSDCRGPVIVCV